MTAEETQWLVTVFPFLFIGMWLLVTTLLGFMSGWFSLQQWYADDGNEEPLIRLGWQSGSMGLGVSFSSCLTLASRRDGLSVKVWRIFGPFQRPLLIPWRDIAAEPKRVLFWRMMRLSFGRPPVGSLKISERTWNRLIEAAGRFAANP
ncbi:MAG TPA: hypothetical protein VNJ05_03330 [Sphingomicrobium sp.]|nr:hypothetical protein [Sphingomicrobium sp.]